MFSQKQHPPTAISKTSSVERLHWAVCFVLFLAFAFCFMRSDVELQGNWYKSICILLVWHQDFVPCPCSTVSRGTDLNEEIVHLPSPVFPIHWEWGCLIQQSWHLIPIVNLSPSVGETDQAEIVLLLLLLNFFTPEMDHGDILMNMLPDTREGYLRCEKYFKNTQKRRLKGLY